MHDPNEMARLHSAGAIVGHVSPFDDLPTHRNEIDLLPGFVKKWAAPYYMEIGSYENSSWVDQIKEIKPAITKDICLNLLGNFNWRTRLVGSYFAAVKDYRELIHIIGTHLLKSEVCCVGHIYALTLAFFNDENCVQYLNRYLDYYLTKPSLYFDQKSVIEAILFLDKENKTAYFNQHLDKWNTLQKERQKRETFQACGVAKILKLKKVIKFSNNSVQQLQTNKKKEDVFSTKYFDEQIALLRDLEQYSSQHGH